MMATMNAYRAGGDTTEYGLPEGASQGIADAVMADVKALGGDGGVIVITPWGDPVFSFNTKGMYRGRATSAGLNEVAIYEAPLRAEDVAPPPVIVPPAR